MAIQQRAREPSGASVRTVTPDDAERGIDSLMLAFSSDPFVRWLFPRPHDYLHRFPRFVRALAGRAFEHGTAYSLDDFAAIALWLPPGIEPDEEAMVDAIQNLVPEEQQAVLWAVLEQVEAYHPTEPHWYLPLIGVDTTHQRRGYGSVLLRHVLARCDEEGTLAYLESSNPENIPLYARHGFDILGMIRVGSMPPIVPMLRTPRTGAD